jgi:hypothetical protein
MNRIMTREDERELIAKPLSKVLRLVHERLEPGKSTTIRLFGTAVEIEKPPAADATAPCARDI